MVVTYGPHDSRCLYEENAPQSIHWAVIDGNAAAVARELIGAVKDAVPEPALIDAKADVMALLERFEKCHAIDPDDVKPVAQDSRLWEMRIEVQAYALLLRIYETEIVELQGHIVALRAHRKIVHQGDSQATKEAQDQEIFIASRRWDDGRHNFWGLP